MKSITLNQPAFVDGKVRFPHEGTFEASDGEADRVIEAALAADPDAPPPAPEGDPSNDSAQQGDEAEHNA